jgi:addiction module RelB/DinJ family antitoxin
MNTASILVKTDPKIKEQAQQTAEEMGISLTSVINRYLKHFIQTKSITFTVNDEIPNQKTIAALKQSEADVEAGRVISFESGQKTLDYVKSLIKNDKKHIRPKH